MCIDICICSPIMTQWMIYGDIVEFYMDMIWYCHNL